MCELIRLGYLISYLNINIMVNNFILIKEVLFFIFLEFQ